MTKYKVFRGSDEVNLDKIGMEMKQRAGVIWQKSLAAKTFPFPSSKMAGEPIWTELCCTYKSGICT